MVDWHEEACNAYLTLTKATSEEIWARGDYAEAQAEWIQVLYEKREALHEEVEKSARTLKEVEEELKETKKGAEMMKKEAEALKAKLLRVEVAKERGEGEAKKLVEQKDKWERLAKKTKEEKEELEKNLRQQLREGGQACSEAGPHYHHSNPNATDPTAPADLNHHTDRKAYVRERGNTIRKGGKRERKRKRKGGNISIGCRRYRDEGLVPV